MHTDNAVPLAEPTKKAVQEYWEAAPCGGHHASAEPGSKAFFAEVEKARYQYEPFIPDFAEFERWRNKDVLEIGFGLGTDFLQFARAGARLHGVDLTQTAADAVRQRLALEGLDADVRTADAESLPFPDKTFDLVYSWGVLHHTPNTKQAIDEARRVLRVGAEARIMLYSRRSWVAFGTWLHHGLAAGRPWRSLCTVLAENMESPGTKAYTGDELSGLFSQFTDVEFHRYLTPYDRRVGGPLATLAGARFGWFVGVTARRPSD